MDTAVALVESLALATSDPLPSTVSVSSLLGDSQRAEAKEVPGWNGLRFRLDMVIIWLLWLIIWMRYDEINYRKHPKTWKSANPTGMVITSCSIFWRLLYTRFIKWYFKAAQRKLTQDMEGTLGEITNLFCLFSSTLYMVCLVISLPPLFLCSNWVDAFFPQWKTPFQSLQQHPCSLEDPGRRTSISSRRFVMSCCNISICRCKPAWLCVPSLSVILGSEDDLNRRCVLVNSNRQLIS